MDCDICVIGSGAGGGPVAYSAANAGLKVIVLEKGPWYKEKDFTKDEIADCRRNKYTPKAKDEPHVTETEDKDGWSSSPTYEGGWNFWNGNMVGGATNLMSGYFQRLKPFDFRLRSEFGKISDANIVDWPISYEDLEPYYDKVEKVIGVSGRVVNHPFQEPRSTPDYPFPPTIEHPLAQWIDRTGKKLGIDPIPLPRAILSHPSNGRNGCSYSGYCGNYGCATGAKGSARAALLDYAVRTGNCEVRPQSMASKIETDSNGKAVAVTYFDQRGEKQRIEARIFVVACQAIETSRLLLMSDGPKHPNGLGNSNNMVGKYLLFSTAASVEGALPYSKFTAEEVSQLKKNDTFINRAIQNWYVIDDKKFGPRAKGGSMDFMFVHPNPISVARWYAFNSRDRMLWGKELKRDLEIYFKEARHVMIEIFSDWLPTENSFVTLDRNIKDKYGLPVAKVRIGKHPHNEKVGDYLLEKAKKVLTALGAEELIGSSRGSPATNLLAGGCRFGKDPATSVLNPDCRMHEVENVYVTDGSFMPTGGSVPYTWSIYANSFRVADGILKNYKI